MQESSGSATPPLLLDEDALPSGPGPTDMEDMEVQEGSGSTTPLLTPRTPLDEAVTLSGLGPTDGATLPESLPRCFVGRGTGVAKTEGSEEDQEHPGSVADALSPTSSAHHIPEEDGGNCSMATTDELPSTSCADSESPWRSRDDEYIALWHTRMELWQDHKRLA